jgi:hypothetical protein
LCSHPEAVVQYSTVQQYTFTHKQYTERHKTNNSTVHIYTQTVHRTTQNKQYIEQHKQFGRVRAVPNLGGFYPDICLTTEETEENHGKPSVKVAEGCQLAR